LNTGPQVDPVVDCGPDNEIRVDGLSVDLADQEKGDKY